MAGEFLTQFPTVNFMTIHLLIFEFLHGQRQTGQWFSQVLHRDSDITETNICSFWQNKSLFNQWNCPHMYATCFGMHLVHPEACQLKNIRRKKQQNSNGPLLTFTVFIVLKDHTKYVTKHIRRMSLLKMYKQSFYFIMSWLCHGKRAYQNFHFDFMCLKWCSMTSM
jgi:hypothetical protein